LWPGRTGSRRIVIIIVIVMITSAWSPEQVTMTLCALGTVLALLPAREERA
jgi:hypothetical protein